MDYLKTRHAIRSLQAALDTLQYFDECPVVWIGQLRRHIEGALHVLTEHAEEKGMEVEYSLKTK